METSYIIAASAAVLILAILAIVHVRRKNREDRIIMPLTAEDFRELGHASRNHQTKLQLQKLYRKVKHEIKSAANDGNFSTVVHISKSLPKKYGNDFSKEFVRPFRKRLEEEGFTVEFLAKGTLYMQQNYNSTPAFRISWESGEEENDGVD